MNSKYRYRTRDSYVSKDPEKRKRQLSNLKNGWQKSLAVRMSRPPVTNPFDERYKNDICAYLEDHFFISETKARVVLEPWQRELILEPLFQRDPGTGLRRYTMGLVGLPKKNSKSTMAAMIANYFLFAGGEDFGEIILAANSKEQSSWIIFEKLKRSLLMNKDQGRWVKIYDDWIENVHTKTVARVVAPNYKTSSGTNPNLTLFDELWAYEDTDSQNSRKFYDELTTSPIRKEPLTLVVSYAGFDEDSLLYEIYKRGLEGKDKKMFFLWSHENLASWITPEYLNTQRKRLRPNTFLRLHENRWMSGESAFIDMEKWDSCIDPTHRPLLPGKKRQLFLGVDVSVSHDSTAVVAVYKENERVFLAKSKKWQPSIFNKMDLEETVELYIKELSKEYRIKEVRYDPFQFHRSAMTLSKEGINMVEFPQTTDRLTYMSQNLFDLIQEKRIVLYDDNDMRKHAEKAIAQETPRGWRIVKKKTSHKIDLIIALGMATIAATETLVYSGSPQYQSVVKRNFYEGHEHEDQEGGDRVLRMKAKDQYSKRVSKFGKGAY
jgi:phage terminase large subunit-like protein